MYIFLFLPPQLVEEEKRLKHLSKIRKLESHKDKFSVS